MCFTTWRVYPGECNTCGHTFRDNEILDDNGDCPECVEAKEEEDEDA